MRRYPLVSYVLLDETRSRRHQWGLNAKWTHQVGNIRATVGTRAEDEYGNCINYHMGSVQREYNERRYFRTA